MYLDRDEEEDLKRAIYGHYFRKSFPIFDRTLKKKATAALVALVAYFVLLAVAFSMFPDRKYVLPVVSVLLFVLMVVINLIFRKKNFGHSNAEIGRQMGEIRHLTVTPDERKLLIQIVGAVPGGSRHYIAQLLQATADSSTLSGLTFMAELKREFCTDLVAASE